jgi:hypothetical protein
LSLAALKDLLDSGDVAGSFRFFRMRAVRNPPTASPGGRIHRSHSQTTLDTEAV